MPRNGHQTLAYDTASNRITTAGFEYDAAGNQTRMKRADGSFQRMSYDAANRLVEVRNDANTATLESYRYGVGNSRVTSETGGTRTYYAGGGGQAAVEYVESVSGGGFKWSKSYIYAGGSVLATIQSDSANGEYVEYHHRDRLGTRLITNNQNASVQEQETLPFGAALTSASTTRQFTSYDRSGATGLDYAVNRRYDSLQGRFTQVDPIGMQASSLTNPQSFNLYAYCGNDPVNHVDPDGLFFKKLFKLLGKFFKGVAKFAAFGIFAFKTARKVAAKVLSSKWGQIAVAVALTILFPPAGSLLFAAEAGGVAIGISLSQALTSIGVYAAGVVSRHAQSQNQSGDEPLPYEDEIWIHTVEYSWRFWLTAGLQGGIGARIASLAKSKQLTKGQQMKKDFENCISDAKQLLRERGVAAQKKLLEIPTFRDTAKDAVGGLKDLAGGGTGVRVGMKYAVKRFGPRLAVKAGGASVGGVVGGVAIEGAFRFGEFYIDGYQSYGAYHAAVRRCGDLYGTYTNFK